MADANLMSVLSSLGKGGSLNDIVIFGRVRCAIKRPNVISGKLHTKQGMFAILDAYAFKCLREDYFAENSVYDVNRVYFTKGSILIFIEDKTWVGKDVKVYDKTVNKGVKIRQQYGNKTATDGITAFSFTMQDGDFYVVPNKLVILGENDTDAKGTSLEDLIVTICTQKEINYRDTLESITEYSAADTYEVLEETELVEETKREFDSSEDIIDVTKIDLNLEYHLNGAPVSEYLEPFKEEAEIMSNRRNLYGDEISDKLYNQMKLSFKEMDDIASDIKADFIKNIANKYNEPIGNSKLKGKYYVEEFITMVKTPLWYLDKDSRNDVGEKELSRLVEELSTAVKVDPYALAEHHVVGIPCMTTDGKKLFALNVMSIGLGIPEGTLEGNYRVCNMYFRMSINSWFFTLIHCPYALGLLGAGLSLSDCDALLYSFSKYGDLTDTMKELNNEYRKQIQYLETLASISDKDSLMPRAKVKSFKGHYAGMPTRHLKNHGFFVRKDLFEFLQVLTNGKIVPIPSRNLNFFLANKWYSDELSAELEEKGLVNTISGDLILESDLEKEILIYDTLIKKGHQSTFIEDDEIKQVIEEFEESRGFKLEALQRDAIKLCKYKAGVLSGCAGSGKTTTSDCMTEVLKSLDIPIVYSTPTGKACRRLAEVVGGTVRTIHSQFGVGMYGEPYLAKITKTKKAETSYNIYIFDEMAMCSTDLLYNVARNLSKSDICYFLGDIKQLPPIGKGNPFKILMTILPCVELGVSKRAAEGSWVNYNTTLINCLSDNFVKELHFDDKTFIAKECDDVLIPMETAKMWKGFMDGSLTGEKYEEDDIQIITGYQKEEILFSAPKLNIPIQQLLRGKDKVLFYNGEREFYAKDRVIHLKRNMYSMLRYVEKEPDVFVPLYTFGIVNGEMGKLHSIVRSNKVNFLGVEEGKALGYYKDIPEEDFKRMLEAYESKEDGFRDDSSYSNGQCYFIKVEVYDIDLKRNVFVLYRARGMQRSDGFYLTGSDLGNLDLAYALTTHKMQGSQTPVAILPFGSDCNPNFVNRNMLNTMVTRSQGVVGMLGSVKGKDSPVTQGRMRASVIKTNDALSILSNPSEE